MLSKKLAIAAASAALMLGAFAPMAFADVNLWNSGQVEVNSDSTALSGQNGVVATSEDGGSVSGSSLTTGAATVSNYVQTVFNNNTVKIDDQTGGNSDAADVNVHNCGFTDVDVTATADSGENTVLASVDDEGGSVSGSSLTTGAATTASNVQTLVNVNSVTVTAGSPAEVE